MSQDDINNHLTYYAGRYPTLISVDQAAEIAQVPKKTIYHWSSLGQLNECKSRRGKHVRISRDCLVLFLLNEGDDQNQAAA